MSEHSNHEGSRDGPSTNLPRQSAGGSVQCCRICQLEEGTETRGSVAPTANPTVQHPDQAREKETATGDHSNHEHGHDHTHHATEEPDHESHERRGGHGRDHGDHAEHTDHTGHEQMFRRRFWVSLVLSVPVIFFSEFIQDVFGYTAPTFPGSVWITPVLSVIIFAYGGVPFLSMARTELENREPGMMMSRKR